MNCRAPFVALGESEREQPVAGVLRSLGWGNMTNEDPRLGALRRRGETGRAETLRFLIMGKDGWPEVVCDVRKRKKGTNVGM